MKYRLRNNYSIEPMTALYEILKDRGVKDIENFIHPTKKCELDPYLLDNIDIAAGKLLDHLRKGSKILLPVDCDQDGISSASVLWLYIKHIFPQANLTFRMHEHKQHGLNDQIDWIEEQDFNLVLISDAGSFDIIEHQRLKDRGIDCIVLDHHSIPKDDNGNDILPNLDNAIVVNNQLSQHYSNKTLCGAGVVYKFCEVLDDILGIQQASEYLDLVALGEIADVMDKTNTETNYLMTEGLKNIKNKGFKTLLESQAYSLKESGVYPFPKLNTTHIAFYIAPLINALLRVGTMQEKETMFCCFIEPDKKVPSTKRGAKPTDIETAAEQTARVGKNAKARQDKIKEKAIDLIDFKIQKEELDNNNILIIELDNSDNIPQEMSGLVAMGIVSKYHKPCLIVRRNDQNLLQGSARGNENFSSLPSLKKYLEESGYFEYAAGHDNAFGAGIKASRLNDFLKYINTHLSSKDFENVYLVDYILNANCDNKELLTSLAEHPEYFGNHIEEIKVIVENIPLANVNVMGANKDCIKISYNGVDYVKFKDIDFIEDIMQNRAKTLTVYGKINLNEYMGKTSIQLFIDDYELVKNIHKYDF